MEEVLKKNGQILQKKLDETLKTGEIPYQGAHSAAKAIDWYDDADKGDKDLNVMISGLDLFISDLEDFERAAKTVQKKATASVR